MFTYSLIFGVITVAMFPYAVRINLKDISMMLNSSDVVSLLCTFQIIESVIFLLLSLYLIRSHYRTSSRWFEWIIPYVPSGIFMTGLFVSEVYLFNTLNDMSFGMTALIFAMGVFALLIINAFAIRILLPSWGFRMEMKVIISFFQIMLGMFLPLILMGLKIQGTQLQVSFARSVLVWIGLLGVFICGHIYKAKKIRKVSV
ncbi:MAG: hypothetical protein EOM23_02045 [Candidatus Moranbacteria bacterium]|nr:hypothetical protein [Candidatus Moranbacteria bacterium]